MKVQDELVNNLKSNMDRFIATVINLKTIALIDLKSNMDRFIDHNITLAALTKMYLKSNMDRFIV